MTTEEIFVRFPNFYWLAHPACFPDLREDPDEADGHEPRNSDKDQINWLAVGQKAQVVGQALVSKNYELDAEDPKVGIVTIDLSDLAQSEQEIIHRWFRHGVCPSGDYPNLENGRHRLWNCWSADSELLLPLQSSFLNVTNEPKDSKIWEKVPCWAKEKIEAVPDVVLSRSKDYSGQLESLALGCNSAPSATAKQDHTPEINSEDLQINSHAKNADFLASFTDWIKRIMRR